MGQRIAGGSVTKRLLCIALQSTYKCKTRGEEQWHCPPRGEADPHTRNPFHATSSSRAPAKACLIASCVLRFQRCLLFRYCGNPIEGEHAAEPHPAAGHL